MVHVISLAESGPMAVDLWMTEGGALHGSIESLI